MNPFSAPVRLGNYRQRLAALSERLLAVPGNALTPRFSAMGSLVLFGCFTVLSLVLAGLYFVHVINGELRTEAAQRVQRVDNFVLATSKDLQAVGTMLSSECDAVQLEKMARASISSEFVNRFHWIASATPIVCSPFNSISDPVTAAFKKGISNADEAQRPTTFLVTPKPLGDILVVLRIGDRGHVAGQVHSARINDYLTAGEFDGGLRIQLRRLDGTVLHDTAEFAGHPESRAAAKLGGRIRSPVDTGSWFTKDAESDTYFLSVQVWADPDQLLSRSLPFLILAISLATLLTAFTVAQINIVLQQRASVERRLRIALRKRQFEPVIQPIVQAQSGRCLGGEVLMRWRHPARGLLSPVEFLTVAEETGLIDEMTGLIMTKARDQLSASLIDNPDLYFSFNVTVGQLRDPDFSDWLDEVFDQQSVGASNIVIELVERDAVDARSRDTLAELRRRGYRIAIDDFGTGQSSLALLPTIGFDALKIDREFVRSIDEVSVNRPVLTAIVELARQLGVNSIAEGVETVAQHEFLIREGVDAIQGYLIAEPMPVREFRHWLVSYQSQPRYNRVDTEFRASGAASGSGENATNRSSSKSPLVASELPANLEI